MRTGLYLMLLLCFAAAMGHAQAGQGFLHYRWGTRFERMQDSLHLELVATHGRIAQYRSSVQSLGSARLMDCDFEFTRNRFTGVFLTTRGITNSRALLAELQQLFGAATTDATLGCLWMAGDSFVAYDEDSAGDATIYWYSISMQDDSQR